MSVLLKLFEGQELSEEFKTKASDLFNEAVDTAVLAKVDELKESTVAELTASLQEDYDAKVAAKIAQLEEQSQRYLDEEVLPEVDRYLTATVNEWKEENQLAIDTGAKVALAESFLQGLVGIAESFNVTVPQSNVLDELTAKVDSLTESLREATDKNVTLVSENIAAKRAIAVAKCTASLSDTQRDKISESLNGIEFKNDTQFSLAIHSLVESTFPAQPVVAQTTTITETVETAPVAAASYASKVIGAALRR
jgi:hypothetical protein